MPLYINTNVASMEAQRNLASSQTNMALNFQRLSSGYRINTAADDAAGLGISENMRAHIRSYMVAERNANNAISMTQVAEAALGQVSGILIRMRELAVQGANGDLTSTDRSYLDTEFGMLQAEITRLADNTRFNEKQLLGGATTTIDFQVGIRDTASDRISVQFGGVTITGLGVATANVSGAGATNSQAAITAVDAALMNVSTKRAEFGAVMNRFAVTISNTQSMKTNLSAANSRIRDADIAEETAALARVQVLSQAGLSVLAQANQSPQMALGLLQN